MQEITVQTHPIEKSKVLDVLKANSIFVNQYAELFFEHRHFNPENMPAQIDLVLCSLSELGFPNGAVFEDILAKAHALGLCQCHACTGLFLRLSYGSQPKSKNGILTGTHQAPDGAVIVLSEFPELDDSFPKGLYLRNVEGQLWLRGYVCDKTHIWSAEDVFAFEKRISATGSFGHIL